jgi:hypothetical protein
MGNSETHEQNRRGSESCVRVHRSNLKGICPVASSTRYHLINTPTPPIFIFKTLQIISKPPRKPEIERVAYVLSSGVAGAMAANSSSLQWSTIRNIAAARVFTLPAAALLFRTLFWLFRHVAG